MAAYQATNQINNNNQNMSSNKMTLGDFMPASDLTVPPPVEFIPRVHPLQASAEFIAQELAWIGGVERVDLVEQRDRIGGPIKFYQAFVHFRTRSPAAAGWVAARLRSNGPAWRHEFQVGGRRMYWLLLKARNPVSREKAQSDAALRADLVLQTANLKAEVDERRECWPDADAELSRRTGGDFCPLDLERAAEVFEMRTDPEGWMRRHIDLLQPESDQLRSCDAEALDQMEMDEEAARVAAMAC